jgi:hypothetical protein
MLRAEASFRKQGIVVMPPPCRFVNSGRYPKTCFPAGKPFSETNSFCTKSWDSHGTGCGSGYKDAVSFLNRRSR